MGKWSLEKSTIKLMAQNKGVITIQKPYLGWIPTLAGAADNFIPQESQTGITSQSLIMYPPPEFQDYTTANEVMINRPGYEGHIAPGPGYNYVTDSNNYVNGLALNGGVGIDGNTYCLLDSNKYVFFGSQNASPSISVNDYGVPAGAVGIHSGHTTFTTTVGDLCVVPTSQAINKSGVFMSWSDNTDGDIAFAVGNVVTKNWLTTAAGHNQSTPLTNGVPHPLLFGLDNFLYCGDGQTLRGFLPTDGSAGSDKSLDLKTGWVVQALATYQNYIAILAFRTNSTGGTGVINFNPTQLSPTKMYLWDGFSTSWNFEYDVQDNFASNILNDGNNLWVITYGRNNTTKLKQFNGQGFDTLWESALTGGYPGGTTLPNPCYGGMGLWLNHVIWSDTSDAFINAYGSPNSNYPSGFHRIFGANTTGIGMVKNFWENVLYFGYNGGGPYSIGYTDFTQYSGLNFVSSLYPLPTNSAITYVKLYPSLWQSSASQMRVGIFADRTAWNVGGSTDLLQWTVTAATNCYYIANSKTIDNINSFYLAMDWVGSTTSNSPIIRKIEVGYSWDDDNI